MFILPSHDRPLLFVAFIDCKLSFITDLFWTILGHPNSTTLDTSWARSENAAVTLCPRVRQIVFSQRWQTGTVNVRNKCQMQLKLLVRGEIFDGKRSYPVQRNVWRNWWAWMAMLLVCVTVVNDNKWKWRVVKNVNTGLYLFIQVKGSFKYVCYFRSFAWL